MIVTTRFPDLPPGPETPLNAAFRQRFRAGWGQVDSVFLARAERLEIGPLPSAPSIKLVLQGCAELRLGSRRLRLEPGRFLLVNSGSDYSFRIAEPTLAFSLHFNPARAHEVAAAQGMDWRAALDGCPEARHPSPPPWREQVQAIDPRLSPRLMRIRDLALRSDSKDAALDEAFTELLATLWAHECRERWRAQSRLSAERASTREELQRRIGWATDFIEAHYARPIELADMANAAHLSKYHFLRAFRELTGRTPADYLRERRSQAARRLLADPRNDMAAVLAGSGFGSRWALRRAQKTSAQA